MRDSGTQFVSSNKTCIPRFLVTGAAPQIFGMPARCGVRWPWLLGSGANGASGAYLPVRERHEEG
jgi:hypothetical protein